jgi:hypothetical protein
MLWHNSHASRDGRVFFSCWSGFGLARIRSVDCCGSKIIARIGRHIVWVEFFRVRRVGLVESMALDQI